MYVIAHTYIYLHSVSPIIADTLDKYNVKNLYYQKIMYYLLQVLNQVI